jgi:hypothetical protein
MFIVEWLFDKMGYQKKIQWTSSSLTWNDVEPPKKRKPAAKKTVRKTVRKKA